MAILAHADHRLVVVTADDAGLQPPTGLPDERTAQDETAGQREQDDHDRSADELRDGELPTHEDDQHHTELDHEVGGSEHEHHCRDEVRSLLEQ